MRIAITSKKDDNLKENKAYKPILIGITILLQLFLYILAICWNDKYKIGLSDMDIERTDMLFLF
jgi:hypothetical protein